MPFTVEPHVGEELHITREFRGSHGHVFAMAVSNRAIYLPEQRMTLKTDSWYFKRVPLSDVVEVNISKQKSIYIYAVSLLLVVAGLLMIYLMMDPVLRGEGGRVSGWPFAILVAGVVIPFIARGRKILSVKMNRYRYKWKPQLALDRRTRNTYSAIQADLLEACRRAGIKTRDE